MIRISLAAILCLTACGQGGRSTNNAAAPANQAEAAPPVAGNNVAAAPAASQNRAAPATAPVPASYDWHFVSEGGSGDLDFGDGDWAEGDKLLSLSCLPGSRTVELGGGPLTLRAGGDSLALADDGSAPLSHPVLQALRASGNVTVTSEGAERNLAGKPAGNRELERFFNYCTTPTAR